MIKVARAGVVIGEYPPSDIPALVRAKVILPTDDYWTAGMAGWSKVSAMPGSTGQQQGMPPALPPQRQVIGNQQPASSLNVVWIVLAGVGVVLAVLSFLFFYQATPPMSAGRYVAREEVPEIKPKFAIIGATRSEGGATRHYYRITGEVKNVGTVRGTPAIEVKLRSSSGAVISSMQGFPTGQAISLAPGETCGLDTRAYSEETGCTIEVNFFYFSEEYTRR
jgi:hypothetical protein